MARTTCRSIRVKALPAITRYLAESLGVQFITGTLARAVEQGQVATTAGDFAGSHVFVCPGHDYLNAAARALCAARTWK